MSKLCALFVVILCFQLFEAAKLPKPVTVRTQLNVKDSENPQKTHFMKIATGTDGKPVGIIIKKKTFTRSNKKPKIGKESSIEMEEDIPEIIGIRVPDDIHDASNVYRNAQIVNNTLIAKSILFSYWVVK